MNPYQQQQGGYPGGQQPYQSGAGGPGYGGYPPQSGSGGYPGAPGGGYQQGGYPPPQQQGGYGGMQQHPPGQDIKQYIQGGLSPGRMVTANLTPGPTKFAINLRHNDGGDIAFHFNPRLSDQVVVRNSCIGGGWQNEERQHPHYPFHAGQPCNVMILCEPNQFKVAVNGQHYMEYRLRTQSLQMITLAELTGDFTNGSLYVQ